MKYLVGYNLPGYLPDNDPSEANGLVEAKQMLLAELKLFLDECLDSSEFEVSEQYEQMKRHLAEVEKARPQTCHVWFGDYVFWITRK